MKNTIVHLHTIWIGIQKCFKYGSETLCNVRFHVITETVQKRNRKWNFVRNVTWFLGNCFQICINPGKNFQLSMSTRKQAQLSMSKRTQALSWSMPNRWAWSQLSMSTCTHAQLSMSKQTQSLNPSMPNQWGQYQLSISTWTQVLNQSIANQWTQYQLVCFNEDQLSMSTWHKLLINQCETNGNNLSLYVSMRTKLLSKL